MRATKATIRPSKAYLRSLITTSQKSTVYSIFILYYTITLYYY